MIQELEMNPPTIALLVVVAALLALALRVAIATWSGKRGCCGRGKGKARAGRVADANANPSRYPYVETIRVEGMACDRCRENVEGALNGCGGAWATVDLGSGTVTVRSSRPGRAEEFRAAIERAGYTVEAD